MFRLILATALGGLAVATGATPAFSAAVEPTAVLCQGRVATILGSNASETLTGTPGDDVIVAFGGNDTVIGGDGQADSGDGGAGTNICDAATETRVNC